jgi:hypothetical protein
MTDLAHARNGFRIGGRKPSAVVGQTYGLITVLDRVEPDIRGWGIPARYDVRCRCGSTFVAKGSDVVHHRVGLCCQPPRRRA